MLELIPEASLQGPCGGTEEAPEAGSRHGDSFALEEGFLVSGSWNT